MKPIRLITIRQLMPPDYLPRLAKLSGAKRPNLSNIVNDENINSKHWKHVEALALESDPETYRLRMEWLKEERERQAESE